VNGGSVTIGTGGVHAGPVSMTGGSIASSGVGQLFLESSLATNSAASTATITGTLNLGAVPHTFTVADGSAVPDLDIAAVIANGALIKAGAGILHLSGSAANTYTGLTTVTDGTLELSKALGTLAVSGNLVINGGTARETVSGQIGDTSTVTVTTSGSIFDLS